MTRWTERTLAGSAAVIAVALVAIALQNARAGGTPVLSTPYHAVALMNGQVFFGRVDRLDRDYIVLTDVFYIQSRQNPETHQVQNVLIKRGGEWHAPDRMIVNRRQIQFLEPVKTDSQVAKLIAEQNTPH